MEARARRAQELDRKASQEYPDAKRLLGALANSRGHRHEENAAKLVNAALEMPREVGAALLASAEGYTPRATQLLEAARERLGTIQEIAGWLADDLPQPKTGPSRARRRRRRKKSRAREATGAARRRRTERERLRPRAAPTAASRPRRRSAAAGAGSRRQQGAAPAAAATDGATSDVPAPAPAEVGRAHRRRRVASRSGRVLPLR